MYTFNVMNKFIDYKLSQMNVLEVLSHCNKYVGEQFTEIALHSPSARGHGQSVVKEVFHLI